MGGKNELKGTCLCGSVKISSSTENSKLSACHCGMCRNWGGGPFLALNCGTDVTIEGLEFITVFDSSAWAERGFCSKCGTHLFYRIKGANQYGILAGIFKENNDFELTTEYYIDLKPDYYGFSNTTNALTEAEVIEIFAPKPK